MIRRGASTFPGLPRQAIVLAAGRGERLRPLTDRLPKPLVPLRGHALIDYHLHRLRRAGIQHCVINIAHLAQLIVQHVGNGSRYGLRVTYSPEPPGALETGGGILHALSLLHDAPFLAVNADIYCEFDFLALAHRPASPAHLVLIDNPRHHPRGDFTLCGYRVGNEASPRLTFSGIGVYSTALFENAPNARRFPLAPLLRVAAARGDVTGEHFKGRWFDLGTTTRLAHATAALDVKRRNRIAI
ncbi:MAG: N-acetylmuramate alpha-1-phosphate uridylyltransferase MurU [Gammaproteobacteria bacterium]